MIERRIHLPPGVELTPQQRRVDEVLQELFVQRELYETQYKAAMARSSERDEVLKKPPRFRYLSEYHASIYDPLQHLVSEGKWSDFHHRLARDKGIAKPEDRWNCIQRYISANVFVLRACLNVRVIELNTLSGIKKEDIATLVKLGYSVMGPYRNWLVECRKNVDGFIEIPSTLSTKT